MSKRHLLSALCLLLCSYISTAQQGVSFLSDGLKPNGGIADMVQHGNTVYMAGYFDFVGYPRTNGAIVDTSTGIPISTPPVNDWVRTAAPDGVGGWYIGGDFTMIGNQPRNRLARINADGSLHPWNPGVNNDVFDIAVSGDKVYLAGPFTTVGGHTRQGVACIDTNGNVTSWNPVVTNVSCIEAANNRVFVGGYASMQVNGVNKGGLADINTTTGVAGNLAGGIPNNGVNTLKLHGNTLFVGGSFIEIAGQLRRRVAAFDATTNTLLPWSPVINSLPSSANTKATVYDFLVDGNKVYIAGSFDRINGELRYGLGAVDINTGVELPWSPYIEWHILSPSAYPTVRSLAMAGGQIYAGGTFDTSGGGFRNNVVIIDPGTGNALAKTLNTDDNLISTLSVSGARLFLGGTFTSVKCEKRLGLAAVDAVSGMVLPWNMPVNGPVSEMVVENNTLYVAGNTLSSIGGQARSKLASIDLTTGLLTPFAPVFNSGGSIQALSINSNNLYVGGKFSSVNNQPRKNLAAFDATSGALTAWAPGVGLKGSSNVYVSAIAVKGPEVFIGGNFDSVSGTNRRNLAAINANTGVATSWKPNVNNVVEDLLVAGNKLYVGGYFSMVGGQGKFNVGGVARNGLVSYNLNTDSLRSWNPGLNSGVRTLAIGNGVLYVAGSFDSVGGVARDGFASIDTATGAAGTVKLNLSTIGSIGSIITDGFIVRVGGFFAGLGGNPERQYYASFIDSAVAPQSPLALLPPVDTTLCKGGVINVNFWASSNYNPGNVFSLQLSDSNGSFASSVVVGTLVSSDMGTGTITGTVPTNYPTVSDGYRLRLVSSSPANASPDNGFDLVISNPTAAQAALTPTGAQQLCAGNTVNFSVPATAGYIYQWTKNGNNINGATTNSYAASTNGAYAVNVTNQYGCTRLSQDRSVTVKPNPSGTFNIVNLANGDKKLTATQGNAVYQWYRNGNALAGATARSYVASVTGNYHVVVTKNGCTTTGAPQTLTFFMAMRTIETPYSENSTVIIYPNPATEEAVITIEGTAGKSYDISVRDMAGRVLYTATAESGREISFGKDLPAGVYMVEVKGLTTTKWIKQ